MLAHDGGPVWGWLKFILYVVTQVRTSRICLRINWTLISWRMYGTAVYWTVQVSQQADHSVRSTSHRSCLWSVTSCHLLKTIAWLRVTFKNHTVTSCHLLKSLCGFVSLIQIWVCGFANRSHGFVTSSYPRVLYNFCKYSIILLIYSRPLCVEFDVF